MNEKMQPKRMEDFKNYLQQQDKSPVTIKEYARQVSLFISWYGDQDTINVQKKDILNYLSYLKHHKNHQAVSSNHGLIALRHSFDCLVGQGIICLNPTALIKLRGVKKRRLHYIYTPEELTELADSYYQLYVKAAEEKSLSGIRPTLYKESCHTKTRNHVMLLFFIHQGLTTREVLHLQTEDIDLYKATVTVQTTTRGRDRILPLHATQTGTLIRYMNGIRPLLTGKSQSGTLFLPVRQDNSEKHATRALIQLTTALKRIDRHFVSLAQIRASLITYWIRTYGLRKAQYMAGHKSIISTEEYLPNHIEELAEDITKFNPF